MVFAGCEDFGIALAEAQAWGTPLIAYGRGGACDIVRPLGLSERPTGILFEQQTVEAVREAVEHFVANRQAIALSACRDNALRFSAERFRREVDAAFERTLALHGKTSKRRLGAVGKRFADAL
jgi:glycosyltransferase involved in cell wall biosynthesis